RRPSSTLFAYTTLFRSKELLRETKDASRQLSLRAKFRYNYYDAEARGGRTYASVGASLSVPIRFNSRLTPEESLKMDIYERNIDKKKLHLDRKSTRLNSSHVSISYAVFCLKKKIICIWKHRQLQ